MQEYHGSCSPGISKAVNQIELCDMQGAVAERNNRMP